jgi:hypothetical protein
VISYPPDRSISEQATAQDLPEAVLVRDLVRVVEVLNLKEQGFFGKDSVLAGSMGLRCFGSPRFTVYDADFATSSEAVNPPTEMKKKLAYRDDELERRIRALESREDEVYRRWRNEYHDLRYRVPTVTRLFAVTFRIASQATETSC